MLANGYVVGDGSWELKIYVTDLKVERTLRVKGDLHVGGLMFKLVEDLDVAIDWSDHSLWWPQKNQWLSRTRSTLDQYGVQADALLHFTPMHKTLRVQLPDLRYIDARVDFSVKTFQAVVHLCRDLGIRHPEEISFQRPLSTEHLKKNYRGVGVSPRQRSKDSMGPIKPDMNNSLVSNMSTPNGKKSSLAGYGDNDRPVTPLWNRNGTGNRSMTPAMYGSANVTPDNSFNLGDSSMVPNLTVSPPYPSPDARNSVLRPKSLVERARLNSGWLDSSLSLYEQDVREFDMLQLKFKFYSYFDLNPMLDGPRINEIYEQARWAILSEEIDCSEEEMMMFAALSLQVNLQSSNPMPEKIMTATDQDIDSALDDLQSELEGGRMSLNSTNGTYSNGHNESYSAELADYLKFMKPRRFTLKSFKRLYFVFKDTRLSVYKSRDERFLEPEFSINLRGSEVTPDVNLSQRKYGIKLEVPHSDGMTEYWIRCDAEEQYAKWMAGFRLASKGKGVGDASFEAEVKQILDFLSMQHPAPGPAMSAHQVDINPEEYVAPRFAKKLKGRAHVTQRILEAHANVKNLAFVEAKLQFIKAWQELPEFGVSLFVVKFANSKKEELLGIASNRIMRMDLHSGDHLKTWRFSTMKAWNVNWEIKQMRVQFEEEDVQFSCLTADCKVAHEFIGGYIFLSMRSKDQNQTLNEDLFHKLTGGWD
ncbi:Uncharacterized protein HDE_09420 [Halotydeus destructor]|nr:Uncharacterized protein HDE_09420 [Halotydeus destructor]